MNDYIQTLKNISCRLNDNFLKDLLKATMAQLNYNDNPIRYNFYLLLAFVN